MRILLTICFTVLILTSSANAFSTNCPQHFANGRSPELIDRQIGANAMEVCFKAFAVLHSGLTRTALYSSEHLTAEHVIKAHQQDRNDDFHAESLLPLRARSELQDYRGSGLDRGHLTPNSDIATQDEEEETFSMANIVPQNPDNNRHLWLDIERAVRSLALHEGEAWVVTGPIYIRGSEAGQWLHGRVRVPEQLYKAVYVPRSGLAGAYVTDNAPGRAWKTVSLAELQVLIGIDVFPGLPEEVKRGRHDLPAPERNSRH